MSLDEKLQTNCDFFDSMLSLVPASYYFASDAQQADSRFMHNKAGKAPKQKLKESSKRGKKAADLQKASAMSPGSPSPRLPTAPKLLLATDSFALNAASHGAAKGNRAVDSTKPAKASTKRSKSPAKDPINRANAMDESGDGVPSLAPAKPAGALDALQALREKLHAKIGQSRTKRKAEEDDDAETRPAKRARKEQEKKDKKDKKEKAKKEAIKAAKAAETADSDADSDADAVDGQADSGAEPESKAANGRKAKKPKAQAQAQESAESNDDVSGSADGSLPDESSTDFILPDLKNGAGVRKERPTVKQLVTKTKKPGARALLKKVEREEKDLKELTESNPELVDEIVRSKKVANAIARAKGEVVRDNKVLLKKSIKRDEVTKKKSAQAWNERTKKAAGEKTERLRKREENITARRDKKQKKKARPGFEGKRGSFLN